MCVLILFLFLFFFNVWWSTQGVAGALRSLVKFLVVSMDMMYVFTVWVLGLELLVFLL